MNKAESPHETVTNFSRTWEFTSRDSLINEFVSISKETNRKPDTYIFCVEEDRLVDPATNLPMLDFVHPGVEKQVANDLQNWASKENEGLALWISPDLEGSYPCTKVIIHRIAYNLEGKKVILNSAMLFEGKIVNPEYKRARLYTLPDSEDAIFKIVKWINKKSENKVSTKMNDHEQIHQKAGYYVDQIISGVPYYQVIQQMEQSGFMGQNSISCAGSSNSAITTSGGFSYETATIAGVDQYGDLNFDCPTCGAVNTRPHGQLISNCQHCGADVTC